MQEKNKKENCYFLITISREKNRRYTFQSCRKASLLNTKPHNTVKKAFQIFFLHEWGPNNMTCVIQNLMNIFRFHHVYAQFLQRFYILFCLHEQILNDNETGQIDKEKDFFNCVSNFWLAKLFRVSVYQSLSFFPTLKHFITGCLADVIDRLSNWISQCLHWLDNCISRSTITQSHTTARVTEIS